MFKVMKEGGASGGTFPLMPARGSQLNTQEIRTVGAQVRTLSKSSDQPPVCSSDPMEQLKPVA